MNFLHNDLKCENLLVGLDDQQVLYLIDFGISSQYMDVETQQHLPQEKLNRFSGNLLFASISQCRGEKTSRRDDIESAFYLLIYLLNNNRLPWYKITFAENFNLKTVLNQRCQKLMIKEVRKWAPPLINKCLKHILKLRYDERPPYEQIMIILEKQFAHEVDFIEAQLFNHKSAASCTKSI